MTPLMSHSFPPRSHLMGMSVTREWDLVTRERESVTRERGWGRRG